MSNDEDDMSDDPMDRFLDRWADEYNPPPETPRDEIWEGVARAIGDHEDGVVDLAAARRAVRGSGDAGARRAGVSSRRGWWGLAAAAAAVLILGIGIGRWSAVSGPGGTVAGADPSSGVATDQGASSFQAAAREHFGRTESFLTLVQADARAGRVDPDVAHWARGLLSQTRLLMDSPAGEDGVTRQLLQDLELILVQVAGVDPTMVAGSDRSRREMDLIASGIEDQAVLARLQAAVPTGPGTRGL